MGRFAHMKIPLEKTTIPKASMYSIFTYIDHKNQPNVGKRTLHGIGYTSFQVALAQMEVTFHP